MGRPTKREDPPAPHLLLTIPEAALELRVSESKMYALLKSGEITAITVGPKNRRVPRAKLEEYIARRLAAEVADPAA